MTPRKPKEIPPPRQRGDDDEVEDALPGIPGDADEIANARQVELAEGEIDRILGETGAGARVRIRWMNPDTGNVQQCGEMKSEDFSLEALADVYGGGVYYLYVYVGRQQVGDRIRVEIDETIPHKNPRNKSILAATGASPASEMMQNMMLQNMESSRRNAEMLSTMMTGFVTSITGMMQATRQNQPNPLEMLKSVTETARAMVPPSAAKTSMAELRETIEMVRELSGGEGGSDPMLPLIGKAIDTVQTIAARAQANNPPRRPAPVRPAAPVARVTAGVSEPLPTEAAQSENTDMRPWMESIQPQLPMLRMMIGVVDPDDAASIIEKKLEDGPWGDLILDIVSGVPEYAPVRSDTFLPFARRTYAALNIDAVHVPWLAELAAQVVVIANEGAGEGEEEGAETEATGEGPKEVVGSINPKPEVT